MSGDDRVVVAICYSGTRIGEVSPVAKSDNSGNTRIKELIYLAICGLTAIAIYFVWQVLSLSNSHVKAGHELDPTESLNDH